MNRRRDMDVRNIMD